MGQLERRTETIERYQGSSTPPVRRFKHTVGVCDDGDKAGEAADGTAGAAGGGDNL